MAIRHKGSLATTVTVSRAPDLSGNFVCDGAADDVEINEALGYVNTLGGGRVVLKQGTFTLAASIIFPGNNIWLRGMGRSTFIDGDALTTGNHAIELVTVTGCAVKKLAIQTQDGGGKSCHCIFIDDDCSNLTIHDVTIVNGDSDGIHIAGTNTTDIHIRGLRVNDIDDNGIYVNMDADNYCYRLLITECMILGAGATGIHLIECPYSEVSNNVVATSTGSGIIIDDACTYCNLSNNISVLNTQHGILLTVTASHCNIEGCVASLNSHHGICFNGITESLITSCLCSGNDSGNTGTYDGIYLDTSSERNNVAGCHCCENDRYGIGVDDARNTITGNYVSENGLHGINVSVGLNKINDNYVYDNNQKYTKYGTATVYMLNNLVDTTLNQFVAGDVGAMVYNTTDGTFSAITVYVSPSQVTFAVDLFDTGNEDYIIFRPYHGINLTEDTDRSQVNNNYCNSPSNSQEDGIHLEDGAVEVQIVSNYCTNGLGDGIELVANNDDCLVKNNYCSHNQGYGVVIGAGSDACVVENNKLPGNITGAISDGGTTTALPYVFVPCPNPSGNIGTHPAEQLTDGEAVVSRFELYVPASFVELVRAQVIVVPLGAGDLVAEVATNWGKVCATEDYNTHTDAIAEAVLKTVVANDLECIDIAAAFTGLAAQDLVGVAFTRHGENGNDTIDANVWLLGLRVQYV